MWRGLLSTKKKKENIWQAILNRRMLICIFNGFVSGLPLYFIYQYIPAWLRTEGVSLKEIGLFSLIGIPYTWKFLWSPIMDKYTPPFLGKRRGWMLITQCILLVSMALLGQVDPQKNIWLVVYISAAIAFFSASQDIVLDAYRTELLPDEELGLGNSFYMNGYRVAGFIPGGLGLILADHLPWSLVHIIISLFMLVGIIKTLLIPEVSTMIERKLSLRDSVIDPLKEFFHRKGTQSALLMLAFLCLYKLGDNMATALSTPFYLDVGFSKTEIGTVVKIVNFNAMLLGSFLGGLFIFKYGINKSLWVFGVVQLLSIFGFAVLNEVGAILWVLTVVIAFEYLGVGLGASALMAFMARSTNKNFTATQLALFTSLIALPRTFANSITGFLIEGISSKDIYFYKIFGEVKGMGYTHFFLFCALCAVPGMVLLKWVAPWNGDEVRSGGLPD